MDGADCSSFRRGRRRPAGECPGRGASANPSNAGVFWGVECARRVRAGDYPPRTFAARPGAIFARFAGSGFAAVRVRPARAAESGVGAGREFPKCPGKGAGRPAPHGATGKAFFRPPGRIRRRGSPPVRRRDIFRYQLLSENIRARRKPQPRHIPPPPSAWRSPESARGANSPNARTRARRAKPKTKTPDRK